MTEPADDAERIALLTARYVTPAIDALVTKVRNGEPLTDLEQRMLSSISFSFAPFPAPPDPPAGEEPCAFCDYLLAPMDTYCCPACGWKVAPMTDRMMERG